MTDVFGDLPGQDAVVSQLERAAAGAAAMLAGERPEPGAMTHAWLFTGPPGSGRSVAARAFAVALLCPSGGCGQCASCHQVFAGTHADLMLIRPEGDWDRPGIYDRSQQRAPTNPVGRAA